jgi:hypothetical protein
MGVAAQEHTKIIKPGNNALQFDAIHEEDRNRGFVFSYMVQKNVLNVL